MSNDNDPAFVGYLPRFGEKEAGVYFMEHLDSGKLYVGSTVNLYGRLVKHTSALKRGEHVNKKLQNAFNESPHFEIRFARLPTDVGDKDVQQAVREQEQVVLNNHRNNPKLLNIATDAFACGAGVNASEETRAKISAAMKGRYVSPETRQRRSESLKGHICSEETKEKIRQAKVGIKQSPEQVEKSKAAAMLRARPVQVGDVIYPTVKDAAEAHGIAANSACKRAAKNTFGWKYADD